MSASETTHALPSRQNFHLDDVAAAKDPSTLEDTCPDESKIPWQGDLLEMFLRNQSRVALAMPVMSLLMALTALQWMPVYHALTWLIGVVGCTSIQLYLGKLYFKRQRSDVEQREWIGMMSASELMLGIIWVFPLFFFWPHADTVQGTFLVAAIMAVSAMRFLVVSNFMPVLISGTGIMTIGIAVRCLMEGGPVYLALASLIIMLEIFFLFIAKQLQETARDMIIFRNQKDILIGELKLERDRAESEKRKAENANHAKSSFLANMSHELRTPLNAILGFSEILEREMFGPMTNDTYKDYAGDIHDSGRYLLGLINDILDISRIEAGRRDISEEPIQLLEPLQHARHLLEGIASDKALTIHLNVDASLPKIWGDVRAVNQVAINILSNAIKFTPRKGTVEMTAQRNSVGEIELIVRDNGPGIPAHEIDQAMSAFTRGSLATKKAIDGAGLGLSIVKGIMDLHGGKIEIKSEQGKGTEVICIFPAKRVLSGPRGEIIAGPDVQTDTQRKLISLTG
jgi:two-component system, cell cycle sensor histidine kinase PleC